MKRFLIWLVSKLNGRKVGDVRYIKASPFIIGSMYHMLPPECWSAKEHESIRYSVYQQRWNGLAWESVTELILTRDELRARLEEANGT